MAIVSTDYVNYLLELLAPMGEVRAKRMFGGYGIFSGDLMFGLVADDTLYLKADDSNRADFTALELEPFVYYKQCKPFSLSYYQAPEDALEDSPLLCEWAEKAYAVAVQANANKRKRR